MTLKLLAEKFNQELNNIYDSNETESIFLMLIDHYLNLKRSDLSFNKSLSLNERDLRPLDLAINRLKEGMPVQYVIGETYFYGLKFRVNPSVLIPRPETEELVKWVIDSVKQMGSEFEQPEEKHLLDIGTGSGCIAISLKNNLKDYIVSGLDISDESINTAKENARLNEVEINWMVTDILLADPDIQQQYSLIISNPPYIKMNEKDDMHTNVLEYEPHHALFVSNENPLIFYNAIADFSKKHLTNQGLLFFEINEYLGNQTIQLLKDKGFINIQLRKDMQGKDRMIRCMKP